MRTPEKASALLVALQKNGLALTLEGERLHLDGDRTAFTPALLARVRAAKPQLVAHLRHLAAREAGAGLALVKALPPEPPAAVPAAAPAPAPAPDPPAAEAWRRELLEAWGAIERWTWWCRAAELVARGMPREEAEPEAFREVRAVLLAPAGDLIDDARAVLGAVLLEVRVRDEPPEDPAAPGEAPPLRRPLTPMPRNGTRPDGTWFPWLVVSVADHPGVLCGYERREAAERHAADLTARHRRMKDRGHVYEARASGPGLARTQARAPAPASPRGIVEEEPPEPWELDFEDGAPG